MSVRTGNLFDDLGIRRSALERRKLSMVKMAIILFTGVVSIGSTVDQARAGDGGEVDTGVPAGQIVEDFNGGIRLELGIGTSGSSIENSGDACSTVGFTKGPELYRYEKIKKTAKDGSITIVDGKLLRTERLVTVTCKGGLVKQYLQCTSCPPPSPPDFKRLVRKQIRDQVSELKQPIPSFWPKPSPQVPLPGVGFFYGISKSQFSTLQPDWLTVCALYECASFFLSAKPVRVYFTPGDGSPRQTSCNWAGPAVFDRKMARLAEDPVAGSPLKRCKHTFQRSGKFQAKLEILYEVTVTAHDWTLPGNPPGDPQVLYGTTGQPFALTVHERQPVVIG